MLAVPILPLKACVSSIVLEGESFKIPPHSQANLRVVQGVVEWMNAHADQIDGFDPDLPTILQLEKLSDSQLVSAVQEMDPLAAGN